MPPETTSAISMGKSPSENAASDYLQDLVQKYLQSGEGMQIMCWKHDSAVASLSDNVIHGAGRTYHFCRANPTTSRDAFLLVTRIARCFDTELPQGDIRSVAEGLHDHLNSDLLPHTPVIVIDDAHHLSNESLEALLLLIPETQTTRQRVKIVLFGSTKLIGRLSQLRINGERKVHCIQIDDKERQPWRKKKRSEVETGSGATESVTQPFKRKSLNTAVILVCLMLLLLSGLYYQASSKNKQIKSDNDVQVNIDEGNDSSQVSAVAKNLDINASTEAYGTENVTPLMSERKDKTNTEAISPTPSTVPEVAHAVLAPNFSRNSTSDEGGVKGRYWILQQPRTNYTLQLIVASSSDALKKVVQDNKLRLPLALSEFRKDGQTMYLLLQGSYVKKNEAELAAKQIEEETAIHPWVRTYASLSATLGEASPAVQPGVMQKRARVEPANGASWIWSRNPVRYTVQVMADNRLARVNAYVEQEPRQGQFAIARVSRDGKPWYLLLSGEYATAEEAAQVAKRLSGGAAADSPRVRTFASVHDQMVSAHR